MMFETTNMKRRLITNTEDSSSFRVKISGDKRYGKFEHMPTKGIRRRCAFCSTKKKQHKTRFMCKTCNVGLCFYQSCAMYFDKFDEAKSKGIGKQFCM